jgi:pyruvate/2-oxoglutarate dehydrogenase complex dihydrolipoamide dehydrogenase (E3) component
VDERDIDIIVIGAGPAGVVAALRAADLGAQTALVTRNEFGGMAANDGPVPVRTLAHAARLIREARQLGRYGIDVSEPVLDYSRLLTRVREVVRDVGAHSTWREQIDSLRVSVYERAGIARFVDPQTIETASGLRLRAQKFIVCTGGISRRLEVPGFEFTNTHSDAWSLTSVPASMLVVRECNSSIVARAFYRRKMKIFRRPSPPRFAPTVLQFMKTSARSNRLRKRRTACV